MGPDPEDTLGAYTFPCGSVIVAHRGSMPLSKNGRVRLMVFGGDGKRPAKPDGEIAPCMTGCPKRHHRRVSRGWLEGVEGLSTIATCLASWSFGASPTAEPDTTPRTNRGAAGDAAAPSGSSKPSL